MSEIFRTAYVYVRNVYAGMVCETDEGYRFIYDQEYMNRVDASPVSLTLPLSEEAYESKTYSGGMAIRSCQS